MHEHVLAAALRLNEAVSFCWIEPFNGTSSHSTLHRMLPRSDCRARQPSIASELSSMFADEPKVDILGTGPKGRDGHLWDLSDSVWRPLPHNSTPDQQDDYCADDSAD